MKKLVNDKKKRKRYIYIRTALEKYERLTGEHLKGDIGVIPLANRITGKVCSKNASWDIIFDYCEGEHLVSKNVRNLRNELRKKESKGKDKSIQRENSNKLLNDFYTKEKALAFYASREWRSLRVEIIEEQKGECQMCGRSHKKHGVTIHVDHIIPLSVDWSRRLDKNNLQLLCEDCNLGKSNRYSTDWR